MTSDNRIQNQLRAIENKRILGCIVQWLLLLLIGTISLAGLLKHTQDKPTRIAIAFGFGGLLIGFATSILTASSRKLLLHVFLLLPTILSLGIFVYSTLLGYADRFPLRLVLAPMSVAAGFLLGQLKVKLLINR